MADNPDSRRMHIMVAMIEELPDQRIGYGLLPTVTLAVELHPEAACRAVLAYAGQTTGLLLSTAAGDQIVPGRWQARRRGTALLIQYELTGGALSPLLITLRACHGEGDGTLLVVEGCYDAVPRQPIASRRARVLAEGLQAGLIRGLGRAISGEGDARIELRASPRQPLQLRVRLRVGDQHWLGTTCDMSAGGLGLLLDSTPDEASEVSDQIAAHESGAVELMVSEARLIARVRIVRAAPRAGSIGVGLQLTASEEATRLLRRLEALGFWGRPAGS